MSRKLRIAVAGLGRIGWNFHCKTIGQHREFELVAVADPAKDRLREAEQAYGCRGFGDLQDMLRQVDLDAVTIATPTHLHRSQAVAALRAGLHVMLEKPMAPDLRDARAIVRAAERAGRILTVYQPHRAAAYFQQLLRLIRSGRIGQVYHVRAGSFRFVRRDDWQSLRNYGGGMLNNYGAHRLDQLLQLAGYDVKKVFCTLRRVAALGDAEDVVKVAFETRGGLLAELDINQATVHHPYDIEVYGTRGVIRKQGNEYLIRRLPPGRLVPKRLDSSLASRDRKYPADEVEVREERVPVDPKYQVDVYKDFARAIRLNSTPFVPAEQTLAVMALMARCRQDCPRILETLL